MSKLISKAIKPKSANASKPKILIFGKSGVGKTWASLDFPNTFYIDTEGGANLEHYTDKLAKSGGMYFGVEQGSRDFATVVELVKELATTKQPTSSWVARLKTVRSPVHSNSLSISPGHARPGAPATVGWPCQCHNLNCNTTPT